jgi:cytosine/adenosine deaminase-related metal-dependent hydrolase
VRAYGARYILPTASEVIEDGVVLVERGKVVAVEPRRGRPVYRNYPDCFLVPAFVNAHTHLDLTLYGRSLKVQGGRWSGTFADWLTTVVAYRRQAGPEELIEAVRAGVQESLAAGTTAVGDVTTLGLSLTHWQPLRGVVFGELLGLTDEHIARAVEASRRWLENWAQVSQPDLLHVGLSPHAPYSTSARLYEFAYKMAQLADLLLATHLLESPEEISLVGSHPSQQEGTLSAFLKAIGAWYPDRMCSLEALADIFACSDAPRWIVAHGNYFPPGLWRQWRPAIRAVVYCPSTHARFGHPPYPVREFLEVGMSVAVGTDSLASASSLSVLEELRLLRRLRPELPAALLLEMGTRAGASALGLLAQLGQLRPGYRADIAVVQDTGGTGGCPAELLFNGHGSVVATILDGEVVFERDD